MITSFLVLTGWLILGVVLGVGTSRMVNMSKMNIRKKRH